MKTLKLTAKDFKDTDSYYKEYCGKEDVSNYDGHIEIEGSLGYVFFTKLSATGHIFAKAGTGIEAGEGIKAGGGIEAGWGIEAGLGIEAGEGIKAGGGIKAGEGIEAGGGIKAGLYITCKLVLRFSIKLFAGICYWRDIDESEKTITCGKLEPVNGATVEYGIVKELGMPDEKKSLSGKEVKVTFDGKEYVAVIK